MRYLFKILLVLIVPSLVGCKKRDVIDPYAQPLVPVNVVLNLDTKKEPTKSSWMGNKEVTVKGDAYDVTYCYGEIGSFPLAKGVEPTENEKKIYDVSVFLFYRTPAELSKNGREFRRPELDRYYYFDGSNIKTDGVKQFVELTDLYIGYYDIYVIANNSNAGQSGNYCPHTVKHHGQRCSFKLSQDTDGTYGPDGDLVALKNVVDLETKNIVFQKIGVDRGIVMNYKGQIALKTYAQQLVLDAPMQMSMAKLSVSATIEDPLFELKGGAVDNIPVKILPFSGVQAATYANRLFIGAANNQMIYVSPNSAGEVSLVSADEATKAMERYEYLAPKNALNITFSAEYKDGSDVKYLKYGIYPGDISKPSVNDYNVYGNSLYQININFKTPNDDDPRQRSMKYVSDPHYYNDAEQILDKNNIPIVNNWIHTYCEVSGRGFVGENKYISIRYESWGAISKEKYKVEEYDENLGVWVELTTIGERTYLSRNTIPQDGTRFKKRFKLSYTVLELQEYQKEIYVGELSQVGMRDDYELSSNANFTKPVKFKAY